MKELRRLRRKAQQASLGPWVEDDGNIFSKPQQDIERPARRADGTGSDLWDGLVAKCEQTLPNFEHDADFIAAANPRVVLAMVACIEPAERLADFARRNPSTNFPDSLRSVRELREALSRLASVLSGKAEGT